uniref:VOC domain-containing protein n=1 Tax=Plectus sambesii TaxID=2011161 RepID=A0A914VEA0_9BILA
MEGSEEQQKKLRMNSVLLFVNDVKKSTDFYHEGLGLELVPGFEISDDTAFVVIDGICIGLSAKRLARDVMKTELANDNQGQLSVEEAQNLPFNGTVLLFAANSEQEVDEVMEKAKKAGAKIHAQPEKKPWGYVGFFRDLDGYFCEVMYWNKTEHTHIVVA